MKSALAKLTELTGYMPSSGSIDYLKSEWDIHGKRLLYGTLLVGSLVYVHFPFSDIVQEASAIYAGREIVKMTFARIQGCRLGYDIGEKPMKFFLKKRPSKG